MFPSQVTALPDLTPQAQLSDGCNLCESGSSLPTANDGNEPHYCTISPVIRTIEEKMLSPLVVLLQHSSSCAEERCMRGKECKEMKQLIHHTLLCKLQSCKVCMEVNEYIQVHASTCELAVCPVTTCNAWR
jgi:hypothetical protein